jgi:hypothetical protein
MDDPNPLQSLLGIIPFLDSWGLTPIPPKLDAGNVHQHRTILLNGKDTPTSILYHPRNTPALDTS